MLYLAIGSPLAGLEAWHGSGADVQPETAFSRFSENSGGGAPRPRYIVRRTLCAPFAQHKQIEIPSVTK
jgi:hypothetical protein